MFGLLIDIQIPCMLTLTFNESKVWFLEAHPPLKVFTAQSGDW